MRHAVYGYDKTKQCVAEYSLDLPMLNDELNKLISISKNHSAALNSYQYLPIFPNKNKFPDHSFFNETRLGDNLFTNNMIN